MRYDDGVTSAELAVFDQDAPYGNSYAPNEEGILEISRLAWRYRKKIDAPSNTHRLMMTGCMILNRGSETSLEKALRSYRWTIFQPG